MPAHKQQWRDLAPRQKALIIAGGAAQLGLQLAALRDLRRRPARQVNGSKRRWVALSFINFLGPLAYFAVGRRR